MTRHAAYFVTGTDTGVGKTFVAAALLAATRRRGLTAAALKPAETGCRRGPDGELVPDDGLRLRAAIGSAVSLELMVPHRYETPVAPAVAARREGRPFSLPRVLACRDALVAPGPALFLVEGAGGLLVPYNDELLGADVAAALALPLLLVARAGLGTINHTLLTLHEARRRGLVVEAVILNQVRPEGSVAEETNPGEIARLGDVPVLGPLPFLGEAQHADPARAAAALSRALPLDRLLDRA